MDFLYTTGCLFRRIGLLKEKNNENPSMLLCASKDNEVIEYEMSRTMSPMMLAECTLQLPDKVVLQKNYKS